MGHEGAPFPRRDSEPDVEITREPSRPYLAARDTSQPNVIARESSGPIAARTKSGEYPALGRTKTGEQPPLGRPRTGEQPPIRRTQTGEQPAVRRTKSGEQPVVARAQSGEPSVGRTKSGEQPFVGRTQSGEPTVGRTQTGEQPVVGHTKPGEHPIERAQSGEPVLGRTKSGEQPVVGRTKSGEQPVVGRTKSGEQPVVGRTKSGEQPVVDPITGRTRSSDFAPVPSGLAKPGRAATSPGTSSESRRHASEPSPSSESGRYTSESGRHASEPSSDSRKSPSSPPVQRDNIYPPAELRAFTPSDPRYARGPTTMERRAASADVDASEWSDRANMPGAKPPSDWIDPSSLQKGSGDSSWTEKGAQDAPWPELAGEPSEPVEAPGMTTLRGQGTSRSPMAKAPATIPPAIEPRRRAATLPPVPLRRAPTVPPTPMPGRRSSPTIQPSTDQRRSGPPVKVDLENATTNPPPIRYNTTLAPQADPRPPATLFQHDESPSHVHTDATATGIPRQSESDLDERVTLPPINENLRTTIPPDDAGRTTPSMPAMDDPDLSVGDDTSPSLDIEGIDTLDIHPGERDEARTNPAMPRFVDERDSLPLRAPPTKPPATRPSKPPPGAMSLASRIDAAMASDEWSPETPVKAPTSAELRNLLGQPDPTRQQSIEEIERLHRASRDVETPDPEILNRPRRAHHSTNEVDPDDIEAAIEILPPARRPSTIGVAKPKKPHE